jgi:hypothetical protein
MAVECGPGAASTSWLGLGGGKALGPDGARRLARLLGDARPGMLKELDLRLVIWLHT